MKESLRWSQFFLGVACILAAMILLARYGHRPRPANVGPTVGEICGGHIVSSDDMTYWVDPADGLICIDEHKVAKGDLPYVVEIIGTHKAAAFQTQNDAEDWASAQPLVKLRGQKR